MFNSIPYFLFVLSLGILSWISFFKESEPPEISGSTPEQDNKNTFLLLIIGVSLLIISVILAVLDFEVLKFN